MRPPSEQERAAIRTAIERHVLALPPERQADGLRLLGDVYDATRGDRWVSWCRLVELLRPAA